MHEARGAGGADAARGHLLVAPVVVAGGRYAGGGVVLEIDARERASEAIAENELRKRDK